VKWLEKKLREEKLEIRVSICRPKQGEFSSENKYWRSVKGLINYSENSRQKEVYFAEQGNINSFLKCWTSSNQQEDIKPYMFEFNSFGVFAGFAEGNGQSCETITRMNKVLEVKCDEEFRVDEEVTNLL